MHGFPSMPFRPFGTVTISGAVTTASAQLSRTGVDQSAVITNPHATSVAFVRFGASGVTAAITDFPIPPMSQAIVSIPADATHAAIILSAATSAIYVSVGDGNNVR